MIEAIEAGRRSLSWPSTSPAAGTLLGTAVPSAAEAGGKEEEEEDHPPLNRITKPHLIQFTSINPFLGPCHSPLVHLL